MTGSEVIVRTSPHQGGASRARWLWSRGLGAHLILLATFLVALVPLLDMGSPFNTDEGAYALQVEALDAGGWALVPPSVAVDPELTFPPWRGVLQDHSIVPYERHPAYPLLLQGLADLGGGIEWALLVTGIGGVLGAAAGAWFLSREVCPSTERVCFWLVAASPVLLHGYILWAHAPSAAAATWAAVFLVRASRARGIGSWAGVGLSVIAGALLRSESLLLAVGFVGAAGVASLLRRRVDVFVGSSAVGLAIGGAVLVERSAIDRISDAGNQLLGVRGSGSPGGESGYLAGRVEGVRHTLLEGGVFSQLGAGAAQLGAILLITAAVLLARRGWSRATISIGVLGVALLTLRVVAMPADPIRGLLIAWPIALAGFVGGASQVRRGDAGVRVLAGGTAASFVAVLATQYTSGSGGWGGRYFTILVPILAVLAVAAWSPSWLVNRETWMRVLAGVSVLVTGLGMVSMRSTRGVYAELSSAVSNERTELVVTPIEFIPRALWRDEQAWMVVGTEQLDEALRLADVAGVKEVGVLWPAGLPLETEGWEAESARPVARTTFDLLLYRLRPS